MSNFDKFSVKITDLDTGEVKFEGNTSFVFFVSSSFGGVDSLICDNCGFFSYVAAYKRVRDLLDEAMERTPVMESVFQLIDGHDEEREI